SEAVPTPLDTARWFTPAHWGVSEETLQARKAALAYEPYERAFMDSLRRTLDGLIAEHLPVQVDGDIEYTINRVSDGWVVGLMNPYGVTKGRMTPVRLDETQSRDVRIRLREGETASAAELVEGVGLEGAILVTVPAGETRIVALRTR
ncbi:MAG: hypothetical protein ABGY41_18485, partial [Candidatus Poribacteria bacterium]